MPRYEYKLIPAPAKARKHKGLKGAASFAATLEDILNEMGRDGWHYLRTDILPQEERSVLAKRTTTYRHLLVFQRELPDDPPAAPLPAADEDPTAVTADAAEADGSEHETNGAEGANPSNLLAEPGERPDSDDSPKT